MKCLAVNTATKVLSIALVEDGKTLHFFETSETRDQGNLLLGHIQKGLELNKLDFADLDLLAVVTGPGSFTGIRIGLAAMRGIALAASKPIIGITSFDMFAERDSEAVNVIAVESWREELYFAAMDSDAHPYFECSNETPAAFAERFRQKLPGHHEVILSGDATAALEPLFAKAVVSEDQANAVDVAMIAMERFTAHGAGAPPVPYYLRNADVTVSPQKQKTLKESVH